MGKVGEHRTSNVEGGLIGGKVGKYEGGKVGRWGLVLILLVILLLGTSNVVGGELPTFNEQHSTPHSYS